MHASYRGDLNRAKSISSHPASLSPFQLANKNGASFFLDAVIPFQRRVLAEGFLWSDRVGENQLTLRIGGVYACYFPTTPFTLSLGKKRRVRLRWVQISLLSR